MSHSKEQRNEKKNIDKNEIRNIIQIYLRKIFININKQLYY